MRRSARVGAGWPGRREKCPLERQLVCRISAATGGSPGPGLKIFLSRRVAICRDWRSAAVNAKNKAFSRLKASLARAVKGPAGVRLLSVKPVACLPWSAGAAQVLLLPGAGVPGNKRRTVATSSSLSNGLRKVAVAPRALANFRCSTASIRPPPDMASNGSLG